MGDTSCVNFNEEAIYEEAWRLESFLSTEKSDTSRACDFQSQKGRTVPHALNLLSLIPQTSVPLEITELRSSFRKALSKHAFQEHFLGSLGAFLYREWNLEIYPHSSRALSYFAGLVPNTL